MTSFANGATINLTLDNNDTITWDGTGKATIVSPSGTQVMMLERAQTLGPFVGGATVTLNAYTPGSYTVNPYSDANVLPPLAAELAAMGWDGVQPDTTFGRTVFASNAAANWSNASSTAPGTIADTTDVSFGDGEAVLKMTFAPSVAAITRATRNFDGYTTAGTNLNGRSITIPVYVTDPSRIRQFFLYLSSQASGFSTFAVASLDMGVIETLVPGLNYLTFHCADASVVTAWSFTTETFTNPIKQMRIAISTYGLNCGPVYIGAPRVSARTRPAVLISMDDGWVSQLTHSSLGFDGACEYLRRNGLRATLYIPPSLIGTANYLTLVQLQELYADGFDIGNHTSTHAEFNATYALGSAAPGATALTISSGAAPGDEQASRVFIDVVTNIGDNSHIAKVTGVRESDGATITEYMTIGHIHGTPNASDTVFSSVSSINLMAADGTTPYTALGTISAYWTTPESEMLTVISDGRNYLINNGMPRAADHFNYPRGMYNPEAVAILKSIGTKTSRTTAAGSMCPRRGVIGNRMLLPGKVLGGALNTSAKMLAETQAAIDQGTVRHVFFHNFIPGAPSVSTDTKWSDFTAFVDDLAAKEKAGLVDVLTISEFYSRYTFTD